MGLNGGTPNHPAAGVPFLEPPVRNPHQPGSVAYKASTNTLSDGRCDGFRVGGDIFSLSLYESIVDDSIFNGI